MVKKRQKTFVMAAPRRYGVRNRGDRSQAGGLLSLISWNMGVRLQMPGFKKQDWIGHANLLFGQCICVSTVKLLDIGQSE